MPAMQKERTRTRPTPPRYSIPMDSAGEILAPAITGEIERRRAGNGFEGKLRRRGINLVLGNGL